MDQLVSDHDTDSTSFAGLDTWAARNGRTWEPAIPDEPAPPDRRFARLEIRAGGRTGEGYITAKPGAVLVQVFGIDELPPAEEWRDAVVRNLASLNTMPWFSRLGVEQENGRIRIEAATLVGAEPLPDSAWDEFIGELEGVMGVWFSAIEQLNAQIGRELLSGGARIAEGEAGPEQKRLLN